MGRLTRRWLEESSSDQPPTTRSLIGTSGRVATPFGQKDGGASSRHIGEASSVTTDPVAEPVVLFVDAMLPDGSRLHVVINDITRLHWSVNIRKFVVRATHLDDLVAWAASRRSRRGSSRRRLPAG